MWFKKKWLTDDVLAELLEDEELTPDRLKAIIKEFRGSVAYRIISLALEDFRKVQIDEIAHRISPAGEGYGRIVAQQMAFVRFPTFFKDFVEKLQGFEETKRKETKSLTEKYT